MFKKEKKTSGLVRRRKMKIAIDNCSTRLATCYMVCSGKRRLFNSKLQKKQQQKNFLCNLCCYY